MDVCNFHILPIPQGISSYHISHQNLVISLMWVHKWNITHVNNIYISLEPKKWNSSIMEPINAPNTTNFA